MQYPMKVPVPQLPFNHELIAIFTAFDDHAEGLDRHHYVLAQRAFDGAFVAYAMDDEGSLTLYTVLRDREESCVYLGAILNGTGFPGKDRAK